MIFDRTFHPDEANQAITTGKLLETGRYVYQPQDHHGPTLYYAAAAIQKIAGNQDTASLDGNLLRSTSLVSGICALLLVFLGVRRFTKSFSAASLSALLLATSPMFVFFATDFIQEMIFAATLALMFFASSKYLVRSEGAKLKKGSWAIIFGIGAGLAFATKETCVLSFASAALTLVAMKFIYGTKVELKSRDVINSVIFAFMGFILTAVIFYSSFGADFSGVYNAFIKAPLLYVRRAAGSELSEGASYHVHEWWWYLKLLFVPDVGSLKVFDTLGFTKAFSRVFTYGWRFTHLPLLCGIILGFLSPGWKKSKVFVFTTLYVAVLLFLYSVISYKTPWCMLTVTEGLAISSGLGIWLFLTSPRSKYIKVAVVLPILALALFVNFRGISFMNRHPDVKNIPYNYAHSSYDVKNLADKVIEQLSSGDGGGYAAVILPPEDTWPLPWYLRKYSEQVGYWRSAGEFLKTGKSIPPVCAVVGNADADAVKEGLSGAEESSTHAVRPGVTVRFIEFRKGR